MDGIRMRNIILTCFSVLRGGAIRYGGEQVAMFLSEFDVARV